MVGVGLGRLTFVEALVGFPFGGVALSAQTSPSSIVKVAAGSGRANDIIKLPGGDRIHVEQFFRDLEKRGEYFGNGSAEDKEPVHRLYGIVNVGPPLKL